jgi:hypothetical protein
MFTDRVHVYHPVALIVRVNDGITVRLDNALETNDGITVRLSDALEVGRSVLC